MLRFNASVFFNIASCSAVNSPFRNAFLIPLASTGRPSSLKMKGIEDAKNARSTVVPFPVLPNNIPLRTICSLVALYILRYSVDALSSSSDNFPLEICSRRASAF